MKQFQALIVLMALALAVGCAPQARADQILSSAASAPIPAGVEADIRQHGAKAAVAALWDANQWDYVTAELASGDAAWIELAPKLVAGSDAAVAEELGISLAFALPKNPRAVLAATSIDRRDIVLGVNRVCGIPFLEDTVKDPGAYERQAVAQVEKVSDPKLQAVRAPCIAALKAGWAQIQSVQSAH